MGRSPRIKTALISPDKGPGVLPRGPSGQGRASPPQPGAGPQRCFALCTTLLEGPRCRGFSPSGRNWALGCECHLFSLFRQIYHRRSQRLIETELPFHPQQMLSCLLMSQVKVRGDCLYLIESNFISLNIVLDKHITQGSIFLEINLLHEHCGCHSVLGTKALGDGTAVSCCLGTGCHNRGAV